MLHNGVVPHHITMTYVLAFERKAENGPGIFMRRRTSFLRPFDTEYALEGPTESTKNWDKWIISLDG